MIGEITPHCFTVKYIGMDIICAGDFAVNNFNGRTMFSFRYPSMKEADFVSEMISQT